MELEEKATKKSALAKEYRNSLKDVERRIKSAAEILKYAEQYQENRPYHKLFLITQMLSMQFNNPHSTKKG